MGDLNTANAADRVYMQTQLGLVYYFDPDSVLDLDAANGVYWASGQKASLLDTVAAVGGRYRRASAGRHFDASSKIALAAADTPRFPVWAGVAQGLLIEAASENKLPNATGASQITSGGNSNVTVAASPVLGPDGALSMQRVTSTATSGYAQAGNITLPADGSTWAASVVVPKAAAANSVRLEVVYAGGAGRIDYLTFNQYSGVISAGGSNGLYGVIDLGSYWLAFITTVIGTNTVAQVRFYPVYGGTGSADLVYGQMEKRPWPTSRIKTAGSALRRERDFFSAPLSALNITTAGTISITSRPPGGAIDRVIAQLDDGTENNRVTIRRSSAGNIEVVWVAAGSTLSTMNLGAHTALDQTKVDIAFTAGALTAKRDDGSLTVAAGTVSGLTTLRLGGNTVDASLDGAIQRARAWPTVRSGMAAQAPSTNFWTIGDSMAAGAGVATAPEQWANIMAVNLGRTRFNLAVGGETSSQMLTRVLADTTHRNWPALIWVGHNSPNAAQTVADITASLAWLNMSDARFLIGLPVQNTSSAVGSAGYNEILATRAAIISAWPNNYVDLPAALAAAGNGGTNDNADIANGYTPRSLQADSTHLNTAGQVVAEAAWRAAMVARGY